MFTIYFLYKKTTFSYFLKVDKDSKDKDANTNPKWVDFAISSFVMVGCQLVNRAPKRN